MVLRSFEAKLLAVVLIAIIVPLFVWPKAISVYIAFCLGFYGLLQIEGDLVAFKRTKFPYNIVGRLIVVIWVTMLFLSLFSATILFFAIVQIWYAIGAWLACIVLGHLVNIIFNKINEIFYDMMVGWPRKLMAVPIQNSI